MLIYATLYVFKYESMHVFEKFWIKWNFMAQFSSMCIVKSGNASYSVSALDTSKGYYTYIVPHDLGTRACLVAVYVKKYPLKITRP